MIHFMEKYRHSAAIFMVTRWEPKPKITLMSRSFGDVDAISHLWKEFRSAKLKYPGSTAVIFDNPSELLQLKLSMGEYIITNS